MVSEWSQALSQAFSRLLSHLIPATALRGCCCCPSLNYSWGNLEAEMGFEPTILASQLVPLTPAEGIGLEPLMLSSPEALSTGTRSLGGLADHDPCKGRLWNEKCLNEQISISFALSLPALKSEARRDEFLPGIQQVSLCGVSASPHCWVLAYCCPAPAPRAEPGVAPGLNMWIHLGLDSCIAQAGQNLPPYPVSLKSIQEHSFK